MVRQGEFRGQDQKKGYGEWMCSKGCKRIGQLGIEKKCRRVKKYVDMI